MEDSKKCSEDADEYCGVYLRPIIPAPKSARKTTSWLGGRPRMPSYQPWPSNNGIPLQFVCQLDCSSLPSRLWGGYGPREGWLVIFAGGAGRANPYIVHIDKLGRERKAPKKLNRAHMYSSLPHDAPEGFDFETPRWPVEVVSDHSDQKFQRNEICIDRPPIEDLKNPLNQPHDWDTLILLFEMMLSNIRQRKKWSDEYVSSAAMKNSLPPPMLSVLERALEVVGEMKEDFRKLDQSKPFDLDLWEPFARSAIGLQELHSSYFLDVYGSPSSGFVRDAEWLKKIYAEKIKLSPISFERLWNSEVKKLAPDFYDQLQDYTSRAYNFEHSVVSRNKGKYIGPFKRGGLGAYWYYFSKMYPARIDAFRWRHKRLYARLLDIVLKVRPNFHVGPVIKKFQPSFPHSWLEAAALLEIYENEAQAWFKEEQEQPERRRHGVERVAAEARVCDVFLPDLEKMTQKAKVARQAGDQFSIEEWLPSFDQIADFDTIKKIGNSYSELRGAMLIKKFLSDPSSMPSEIYEHCLLVCQNAAGIETFALGGPITDRIEQAIEAPIDEPILLLDFSSSRLLQWMWSDVENLVIVSTRDNLESADFGSDLLGFIPPV